jgi:thiol-disulfide isomerase/thioredoxin
MNATKRLGSLVSLAILISCFVTAGGNSTDRKGARSEESALSQKRASDVTQPQPADTVPKVEAIDTDRLKQLLKRDSQKPLLVNFWATWCDPCRDEFPDLVKVDADYRAKGLEFIAITLDDVADINTEVPKFLRTMRARMPAYLLNVSDPEPAITLIDPHWGGALPATFLYDPKGQVVYKTFGRVKVPELRAAIDTVISPKSKVQSKKSVFE